MKKNVQLKKYSSSKYSAVKLSSVKQLQELMGRVSVSVTWKQVTLLQKTLLRRLSLHTSSSLRQKVCVVPRVDLDEEEKVADNRLEVTDLEVTPPDIPVKGEGNSSMPEDLAREHLCIYFHCTNFSMLKVYSSIARVTAEYCIL